MRTYNVSLEISGPTAMWTRPDTGDTPVSYPVPTYSAVKGIFESILWLQSAEVIPEKAEVCRPIVYHNYTTNYGGPLRKGKSMDANVPYQLIASVLVNVCYRLYASVVSDLAGLGTGQGPEAKGCTNGAHAYQELFERRLKRGECHSILCLGWKEFVPDYVGLFRDGTTVQTDV
ncbi:MAG TPA: CRISPR-associated protein Cas5, partial [Tepidisphaeraceae bacterium]